MSASIVFPISISTLYIRDCLVAVINYAPEIHPMPWSLIIDSATTVGSSKFQQTFHSRRRISATQTSKRFNEVMGKKRKYGNKKAEEYSNIGTTSRIT